MNSPIYHDYEFGITCIDTMYVKTGHAACYLLTHNKAAAFIDTGTGHTVPYALQVLKLKNIPVEAVEYVIPTHVHLDHAGGAGLLMSKLPNAKLVIHPRGAPHMINPEKLIAGATAVYGKEKFTRSFGQIIPIDETRVIVAEDNSSQDLAGRNLKFIDTPGHARHHFCVYDETSKGFFTGDTFGLSYREFYDDNGDFILPTTSPVQFEPDAWQNSLTRLLDYKPEKMYLTHFGQVTEVQKLAQELRADINHYAETAKQFINEDQCKEKINNALTDYLQQRLSTRYSNNDVQAHINYLKPDLELNAAGLEVWLNRLKKAA